MYKIEIKNAQVSDNGYGLYVNGKSLSDIISTLLGTKVGTKTAFADKGLDDFYNNSCDITICITPNRTTMHLEDAQTIFKSIEKLEEARDEQFNEKTQKTGTEE